MLIQRVFDRDSESDSDSEILLNLESEYIGQDNISQAKLIFWHELYLQMKCGQNHKKSNFLSKRKKKPTLKLKYSILKI